MSEGHNGAQNAKTFVPNEFSANKKFAKK